MRRPRLISFVLVGLLLLPVGADAQSLAEVRAERARIQARLDAAASELSDLESRQAELEAEQAELGSRLDRLAATVAETDDRIRGRVRAVYKGASADPIVMLLSGEDPQEAVERAMIVDRLVAGDRDDTERARNARTELKAVAARLADTEEELATAAAERRAKLEAIQEDLERAQELEERLEAEERARQEAERRRQEEERRREQERQRQREAAAAPAPSSGSGSDSDPGSGSGGGGSVNSSGMACPMARPHSFTDTWGAPRSGGRRHKGTDILAPRGQTVIAIVDGVWDVRSYGRSAGHWGVLRGTDGNVYYYMHLERHVVGDGARVSAGQQVATNGDTGNARGTPHLHFELHPGGGSAVNPYPTLRRVCG